MNHAVIYSNGIADFRRSYDIVGGQKLHVALPVRQGHVGDVLASLQVLGAVRLASPPTYRPANESDGSLDIEPANVLEGLARSLAGAQVTVVRGGETQQGVLVGLHQEQVGGAGEAVTAKSLIVQVEGELRRTPLKEIQSLTFTDAEVRSEIDKALQRSVQQIKPNSTFVEFDLAAERDTSAIVQYTIPAAAWKISYRLRQLPDETFELQGYAIVDNNTDENWREFQLSVVTGEPVTFSTDLAESKTPSRGHVNIVSEQAMGVVEVEEAMLMAPAAAMQDTAGRVEKMQMSRKRAASYGFEQQTAEMETAVVHGSDDFCRYEAQTPVSIDSNRSAVVPVFHVALDETRSLLHYRFENHSERPMQTIQFHNQMEHGLGRGVCTVFLEGVYAGSCIVPATKPAGVALLPHAVDTAVRIRRRHRRNRNTLIGIRLSAGACRMQHFEERRTEYQIRSGRSESRQLILDHTLRLSKKDASIVCALRAGDESQTLESSESLADGVRYRLDVPPQQDLTLEMVETATTHSDVVIAGPDGSLQVDWFLKNLAASNGPLSNDPAIQACIAIQRQLDEKQGELSALQEEVARLSERQERLRKNIAAGGEDDQTIRWRSDLGRAEDKLVEIEDVRLPKLLAEQQEIEQRLYASLRTLELEWSQ